MLDMTQKELDDYIAWRDSRGDIPDPDNETDEEDIEPEDDDGNTP